jgi:hypothetical protein
MERAKGVLMGTRSNTESVVATFSSLICSGEFVKCSPLHFTLLYVADGCQPGALCDYATRLVMLALLSSYMLLAEA